MLLVNLLNFRVRMILVLGYWVLGNIHRYWVVLLLGGYFLLFWHPIQYQSESSQQFRFWHVLWQKQSFVWTPCWYAAVY